MRPDRPVRHRTSATLLATLLLAAGVAACSSDDDGVGDEPLDLNEDFEAVPGATVQSPALSDTTVPAGAAAPFGTVAVDGEVYPVDAMADDGGDFTSCIVDPADREGYVDIAATLDERTFAFTVVQGTAGATIGAASTVVDDYEIVGSSVRGTAQFDAGDVAFDITC